MIAERFERLRADLAPLASPSAFSLTTVVVASPLIFAIQVPANFRVAGGPFALWALASVTGLLVMAGVLAAASVITVPRGGPSIAAVLVAYVVATVAQPVTFGAVAFGAGLIPYPLWTFRAFGVFVYVPVLMVSAIIVERYAQHRRVIADLEAKRARLLEMGPSLDAALDRAQGELVVAVRASIEPALASLDAALAVAARDSRGDAAVDALDDIVEQELRPLSRDLVAARSGEPSHDNALATDAPARVPLPRRFALARGIRPDLAGLAVLFAAVPGAVRDFDPPQVILYVVSLALGCGAGLAGARRLVGTREVRTWIGVPLVIIIHMAVMAVVFWLLPRIGIAVPRAFFESVVVYLGVVGALTVGIMLVGERRAESEAELASATERLERAVALTVRRERLMRRRLAFVLHGSLQGALHAAALRVGEGAAVDQALVDEIRADVDAALAKLGVGPASGTVSSTRRAVDELVEVWQGHRYVTARLGTGVEQVLSTDADADEGVAEVVREAVNNAFRHGGATQVDVDVRRALGSMAIGRPAIAVVVRDDGSGRAADATPGLGTVLLDDVCESWRHESEAGASTLRAQVALATSDSPGVASALSAAPRGA